MIPTSWLTVVLFLFLVAPGLLFDLLAERRRSGTTESAFREASRVILASIWFNVIAYGILAVVRAFKPKWLPDPALAIRGGESYVADHYNVVLLAIVAQAGLAMGAAYVSHMWLARGEQATIRQVSAWTRVFKESCPKDTRPVVRVKLTNGATYGGLIVHFTSDHKLESRELVLGPPLFAKPVGEDKKWQRLPSSCRRVVLRGTAIETITVEYHPLWMVPEATSAQGRSRQAETRSR